MSSGSVMTALQSVVSSLSVVNCGLVCDESNYTNFTS